MLRCRIARSENLIFIKKRLGILFIVLAFLFGIYAPNFQIKDKELSAWAKELKQFYFNLDYPQNIVTSRYAFDSIARSKDRGPYFLEKFGSNTVLGLNRNNGKVYKWVINDKDVIETLVGQVKIPGIILSGKAPYLPPIFTDVLTDPLNMYVSIVIENPELNCQSLNLYKSKISNIEIQEKIFETPCIDAFTTVMWGGKLSKDKENNVYFSVGEMRFDTSGYPLKNFTSKSFDSKGNLQYTIEEPFGTVIKIDPNNNKTEIYTTGHRNIQGLFYNIDTNKLISTEHGPFGGDEINILENGQYYGWPKSTFGKPYPENHPGNTPSKTVDIEIERKGFVSGKHSTGTIPIDSWSPGVGPSAIITVPENSFFSDWAGDIVYSSMKTNQLVRVTYDFKKSLLNHKEFITLSDSISDLRVRDFELLEKGYLVLSFDNGQLGIYKQFD
jgi:hypothetical protein